METPWGLLNTLDLSDLDLAAEILSADKHQLVEGLVVEGLFDQIVDNLSSVSPESLLLDVDTVVVSCRPPVDRLVAFVWARSKGAGLGRYLARLGEVATTHLLTFDGGDFRAELMEGGRRAGPDQSLKEAVLSLAGTSRTSAFTVADSVKDKARQMSAIWGFLHTQYQHRLADRVVLPRLLINCGIQPHFRALWNLDRILVHDDQIWLLEVKHKFPMERGGQLSFGINDGELNVISRLAKAGVRCLHAVIVKPFWSKDIGSMYLLSDLNTRSRAGLIGMVLDEERTSALLAGRSSMSGAHTSITGSSALKYKSIPLSDFRALGVLSDSPVDIATRMHDLMIRSAGNVATESWLRELRVS